MAEKFPEKDFLEFIVKNIVGNPDDVKVDRKVDEMGVLLTLDLNPADMGYVIGKKGATARSIRTLLKIIGAKNNARVNLKITEPEGSERPPRTADVDTDVDTDVVDDLKI
ncbi:KH domain-containing protein [Patescibacteria group bacterium]